jgi:hypothetical protein
MGGEKGSDNDRQEKKRCGDAEENILASVQFAEFIGGEVHQGRQQDTEERVSPDKIRVSA